MKVSWVFEIALLSTVIAVVACAEGFEAVADLSLIVNVVAISFCFATKASAASGHPAPISQIKTGRIYRIHYQHPVMARHGDEWIADPMQAVVLLEDVKKREYRLYHYAQRTHGIQLWIGAAYEAIRTGNFAYPVELRFKDFPEFKG
ncbi:MAG TPA: hypothetical protein VHF05_02570 [Candidatus Paceibacterota bacterium]|jgi:hypothetical protein|nr:hypothetical protein [Candidatus Paceibacterota bacterium]